MLSPGKLHFGYVRLLLTLGAILVLLPFQLLSQSTASAHPSIPTSYSCGDKNSGHCYAINDWYGGMAGAKTNITLVNLVCNGWPFGSCDSTGFVDDEIWVIDDNASGDCSSTSFKRCWVEQGIINDGSAPYFFWADVRPIDKGLNYHDGPQFGGYFGDTANFTIQQTSSNTWSVSTTILNCGCSYQLQRYSTSNTMHADDINIGQELAGTDGASAPRADFTYNYWFNGSWHPQGYGNGPGPFADNPPHGAWVNGVVGGPTGGDWYDYCC